MAKRTPPTHSSARRQIEALGARLRTARLRRSMTQEMLADRVGVSIPTISKLEAGDPRTSLATMLRVLGVLGFSADLDSLAAEDPLGRVLQDTQLPRPSSPLSQKLPSPPSRTGPPRANTPPPRPTPPPIPTPPPRLTPPPPPPVQRGPTGRKP